MPPRKKTKLSSRAPSSPSVDTPKETTPAAASKASQEIARPILDPDPWTDDQEAVLFKNVVRYKPVGLHKHTRMFCILTNLRRYGWQDEHISRNGVWQKLDTLYNMETLHEREDADELEREDTWAEFWLPSADFGEAMFSRRINLKRSSSPPTLHHQLSHRAGADTKRRTAAEERKASLPETAHKSSPEPEWESGRDGERRRSLRGRGGRGGRGASRTQSEAMTRKRKRAETPPQDQDEEEGESDEEDAENEVDGDEGEEEEDGEEEDGEEEEGGEDDEEDEEDEEEGGENEEEEVDEEPSAPANRGGRGRSTRTNPQKGRGGSGAGSTGGRGGGKTRGGRAGRATPRGRTGRGGRARGR